MKINSAIIRNVLWVSKTLKDGTHPVMLCIRFNGQSLISTTISCKPKDWDNKNQCLKRSFPNASALNAMLADMLNRAIKIKIKLEQDGITYNHKTIADLYKGGDASKSKPTTFYDIMQDMFEKRSLAVNSRDIYHTAYLSISRFLGNPNFLPSDINDQNIKDWAVHCSNKCCTNTMLNYLYKISTTLTYATKIGVAFNKPIEGLDWIHSHYKAVIKHRSVNKEDYTKLVQYFEDKCGIGDYLLNRTDKRFALAFWLASYGLQGLAPIDLLQLKADCVTITNIRGIDVYKIVTKRQKTQVPLVILSIKHSVAGSILTYLLETANARDGYVFPVFYANCDKNKLSRTLNTTLNKHLSTISTELGIPKITAYSARHSYATHQIANGCNIGTLANSMGRSINNIGTYISNLSSDEDLFKLHIDIR